METCNYGLCSIEMHFDGQRLSRALELLLSAAGPIRAKVGCRCCRVESDAKDVRAVRYTEEWASRGAMENNIRSADFWRILLALDLCDEEPHVMIGDVTASTGMEALQMLRSKQGEQPLA